MLVLTVNAEVEEYAAGILVEPSDVVLPENVCVTGRSKHEFCDNTDQCVTPSSIIVSKMLLLAMLSNKFLKFVSNALRLEIRTLCSESLLAVEQRLIVPLALQETHA